MREIDNFFKTEDFVGDVPGRIPGRHGTAEMCANRANSILRDYLKEGKRVFGNPLQEKKYPMWSGRETTYDTHYALLIDMKELEKKP